MTKYDLSEENEFNNFKNELVRAFQSCNLNFLIGAGASIPAISTLGNIEKEIDELFKSDNLDEAIQKSYKFLQNIYNSNEKLNSCDIDKDVEITKNNYNTFLNIIYSILVNRKNYQILPNANIYTTNYDLFLEYACETIPYLLHYNDGFINKNKIFTPTIIDISEFNKKVYYKTDLYNYNTHIPSINILKLHGSLNWKVNENDIISYEPPQNLLRDLNSINQTSSTDIDTIVSKIGVVLPNYNKFKKTVLAEVYFNFLRYFSTTLLKENSIMFSLGFSFNDKHIKELVKTALSTNPTLQLVISVFNKEEIQDFENKFMQNKNVTFLYDSTKNLDFTKMNDYLIKIFEGLKSENS